MNKNTPILVLGAAAITGLAVALKGWFGGRGTVSLKRPRYGRRPAWQGTVPPAEWRPAPKFQAGQKVRLINQDPLDRLNLTTVHTIQRLTAAQLVEYLDAVDERGDPAVKQPDPMPPGIPALAWEYTLDGHPRDLEPVWPGPGPVPPERAESYQATEPLVVDESQLAPA